MLILTDWAHFLYGVTSSEMKPGLFSKEDWTEVWISTEVGMNNVSFTSLMLPVLSATLYIAFNFARSTCSFCLRA